MSQRTSVDTWIGRAARILICLLLVLSCYMVWRVSMVVYRTEQLLVNVSQKVDRLEQRVARVENHLKPTATSAWQKGKALISDPKVQEWLKSKVRKDQ